MSDEGLLALTRDQILELLPHRPPMLMIDRVLEMEPGARARGVKDVRPDEPWCAGHFPGNPVMPGVLIAEALAQLAALVYLAQHAQDAGHAVYLVGMDKMRFRRPVRPGVQLVLDVVKTGEKRRIWTFDATATVDGQRVATGSFMATLAPSDS